MSTAALILVVLGFWSLLALMAWVLCLIARDGDAQDELDIEVILEHTGQPDCHELRRHRQLLAPFAITRGRR